MVEIFKTDIDTVEEAEKILQLLLEHYPDNQINFDLEDYDNILRIEGSVSVSENVTAMLHLLGYSCEELL